MTSRFRTLSRTLRRPLHRRQALRRMAEFHARPRSLEEVVQASLDLGTNGLFKVKAGQKREEILALARCVLERKPRVILEIGTARGGTLLIWAQLASHSAISCDLENPDYRRELYQAFPPPGSACQVKALCGDSHDPGFRHRVETELDSEQVDLLFIDGDHSEVGVTQDFEDYQHLVRPGGLIAFHDIVEDQPYPDSQVYALWRRLREELSCEEFVADPRQCGFGIGVIRTPER